MPAAGEPAGEVIVPSIDEDVSCAIAAPDMPIDMATAIAMRLSLVIFIIAYFLVCVYSIAV